MTLVQISNLTTYFMLFSRSPSPGEKDVTYKGCSCSLTPPAFHTAGALPQVLPRATSLDHSMYQTTEKVFMKPLYIIEESSLSHPHPFRLSKKHTKNAAIMLVCLGFLYYTGRGSPSCHATCFLSLCLLYLTSSHRTKIPH